MPAVPSPPPTHPQTPRASKHGRRRWNADLRRLEAASLAWNTAEQLYLVGLVVFAYERGGATGVALVGLMQALPLVLLLPIMVRRSAGMRLERLLPALLAVRAASIGTAAILLVTGGPALGVLACAAVDALAAGLVRPTRSAVMPRLARSPEELITANVTVSSGRSIASLIGPGLATLLLATRGQAATMALGAALFLLAFAISLAVRPAPALPPRPGASPDPHGDGLSVVRREREPRALVAGLAAYQLLRGSFPVLVVLLAVEVLGGGEEAVGLLNAAIGLGAVVGAAAYATFARRRRLSRAFTAAGIAMGVSAALAGLAPSLLLAGAALAIGGAGRATAEVAGLTLLQRTVPIGHRGSVFGILETVGNLALAAGAVIGAALGAWIGAGPALLVAGLAALLVPVVTWPDVRHADEMVLVKLPLLHLLQRVPMFGPLSLCTVEELASGAERVVVPPGLAVISEGDRGDRFYVVESGELATTIERRAVRNLTTGDSFGEIALLRDVPRTATITTTDETVLLAIDRDHFLAAVMGRAEATTAADSVVGERLGRDVDR